MLDLIVQNFSFPYLFLFLCVFSALCSLTLRIKHNREIKALGARAPIARTYLPMGIPTLQGIELIYRAVRGARTHKNLEFWEWIFAKYSTPASPYTVESTIGISQRVFFTAEPENIKAILTTQFEDYGKGEPFHNDWKEFLGDSIFVTDGEQWQRSRQLIRTMFMRERVAELGLFEKHVEKMIPLLEGNGREVKISNVFFRYTLDAATDFLLGGSVNSLDDPKAEFAEAFSEVQRVQNIIARAGPLNFLVPRASFRRGLQVMNEFIQPFITRSLSLSPSDLENLTKSSHSYTFLHALSLYTRDPKVIRDQLVSLLLAGRDTTAATLSWTFFELSRRPAVYSKLRNQVLSSLGPKTAPTYSDLKDLTYLTHILNETLRLYPAVPFNVRLALGPTTLPRGGGPDGRQPVGITKNTAIGYSTLLMQRRRDLYPPVVPGSTFPYEVLDWVPERWETWTPTSWRYIPFNGGPRICIGQGFAMVEMAYTIVRIVQKFERCESLARKGWSVDGSVQEDEELVLKAEIVLQPGKGVKVGFWEGDAVRDEMVERKEEETWDVKG